MFTLMLNVSLKDERSIVLFLIIKIVCALGNHVIRISGQEGRRDEYIVKSPEVWTPNKSFRSTFGTV